jgi:hypothetical protein
LLDIARRLEEIALKDDSSSIPANNAMAFLYEKLNKYKCIDRKINV